MLTSDLLERSEGKSDVSMLNFALTLQSRGQSPFYHDVQKYKIKLQFPYITTHAKYTRKHSYLGINRLPSLV